MFSEVGQEGGSREEGGGVGRNIGCCSECIWYSEAGQDHIYGMGICKYGFGQKPPSTIPPDGKAKIVWGNDQGCEHFAGTDLQQNGKDKDIS
jgi:hypothetical protein